jgi:hypothetical protein
MKLRIHNNAVRVRLTQGEVTRLAAGERVEQTTTFSFDSKLMSSVEPADVPAVTVTFVDSHLAIRVPRARLTAWAESNDVGINATQPAGEGELRVLIEKDFKCLHGDTSENVDAYPNPNE